MVTVEYQIASGQADGSGRLYGNFPGETPSIKFGEIANGIQAAVFTFVNVQIPRGAVITEAYLRFWVQSQTAIDPAAMTIWFDDDINTNDIISTTAYNSRTKTTASVSYAVPDSISNAWQNSTDFSTIIQELVSSYDYSAGTKKMTVMMAASNYGLDKYASINPYDDSPAYAAKLIISYEIPSCGGGQIIGLEIW